MSLKGAEAVQVKEEPAWKSEAGAQYGHIESEVKEEPQWDSEAAAQHGHIEHVVKKEPVWEIELAARPGLYMEFGSKASAQTSCIDHDVKEEIGASEDGVAVAPGAGLYPGHTVKEELVVMGPEEMHPPKMVLVYPASLSTEERSAVASRACSVKLEHMHIDLKSCTCSIGPHTYKFRLCLDTPENNDMRGHTDDCIKYCTVTQEAGSLVLSCNVCDKSFKKRHLFRQHYQHVHLKLRKKKHPCVLCKDELFPWQRAKHMEQAHGWEAPTCGACGKKFPYQYVLVKHQKAFHLGEKNVKCDVCNMAFADRRGLKRHAFKHSELRNYKCELCSKAFKTPKCLAMHLRIHLNDRRCVCEICGDAFVQTSSLKYHMARQHPDVC